MRVIVDFYCDECGVVQTEFKDTNEDMSKSICTKCNKEIERTYTSAPAVQFKGSGWFKSGGY